MRKPRFFVLLMAAAFLSAFAAHAQDAPSLGDVARQARLQKQQKDVAAAKGTPAKDAPDKDAQGADGVAKSASTAKAAHVITNDEIPSHVGTTLRPAFQTPNNTYSQPLPSYAQQSFAAEQWKAIIQNQKSAIASLQREIDNVSESIRYAGANCVANCVQWNESQKRKQDQVESMKDQLEQQQKRLEDLQEMARKQGLGSAVYDP